MIVSYNTEAPTTTMNNPVILSGALVINPITWTQEDTLAPAEQSLGSIALDQTGQFYTPVKNYADAQIDKAKGALICSTIDPQKLAPGNALVSKGIFHNYDYPFYYYNIRENAATRVKAFMSKP